MTEPESTANKEARRVVWIIAVLGLLVCMALLYQFNPASYGLYPQCFFHRVTGLDCPGCGGLRAAHQLLHGNFSAAFRLNPLLICLTPFAVALGLQTLAARVRRRPAPRWLHLPQVAWTLVGVVIGFGLLRNLPWRAWLS